MDAVDALNEIAFWLERSAAPTFKVQAFRKAAGVIADLAADDLAERARDGRLKRTKGIGDTTFQVIRQAVEGAVPDYLDKLRQGGAKPLAAGGNGLRSQLRGDLHSHSNWSDGGSPIDLMADAARYLGREYLALTDHSPNLKIANGLSVERLSEQGVSITEAVRRLIGVGDFIAKAQGEGKQVLLRQDGETERVVFSY